VSGRTALQVTNNTSWQLFISEGGTAPSTDPGSAKYVVPPRATGILPVQSSTISYRWTGAVAGNGDLISSVFSDDQVAPQIIPGVNAQGFNSVTGYSGSNSGAFQVTLGDANGFPTIGTVNVAFGAFANGLLIENPLPVPVSIKRPGGAAKDFLTIVPPWSSQVVNIGATSADVEVISNTTAPVGSLAKIRLWPLETVQPWTPPVLSFDWTRFPPTTDQTLAVQVKMGFAIGGMVVGTRQNLYTLAIGELFVLKRIRINSILQASGGGFAQLNFDTELSAGFNGAGASTIIATDSATCVASGATTGIHEPFNGALIIGGGAAGNNIRINPTGLSFLAGAALYGTLEGWKVPINNIF
jgi:hypothetical protein